MSTSKNNNKNNKNNKNKTSPASSSSSSQNKNKNKNSNNNEEVLFLKEHLAPLLELDPVPLDENDDRYTQSFSLLSHDDNNENHENNQKNEEKILNFFQNFGFVVIRDVLTAEDCQRTMDEIMDLMERHTNDQFKRQDRSTWVHWPAKNSMEQYGAVQRAPIFSRQFILNRCNENVYRTFHLLLSSKNGEKSGEKNGEKNDKDDMKLMVSHDRACFYRPTIGVPGIDASVSAQFRTKLNVHLDMNPWNWMESDGRVEEDALSQLTYGGSRLNEFIFENNQVFRNTREQQYNNSNSNNNKNENVQLQGGVNLLDNWAEDGGFLVVPHFHKIYDRYFTQVKPDGDRSKASYGFGDNDPVLKYAQRVCMRAGSMVVWGQYMPHGSAPNYSDRPRSAQFIKMFPTTMIERQPNRFKERCATIRAQLRKENISEDELPSLAQQVLFNNK